VLALLLVLWALLPWSVRGFVTKLKIGHEVLTAASSFFNGFLAGNLPGPWPASYEGKEREMEI
jgi:hypothetical protein